jgi:Rps23 Pro-64 3,4-dihydroxylase Tpa1-like proline 4-hydroxylase
MISLCNNKILIIDKFIDNNDCLSLIEEFNKKTEYIPDDNIKSGFSISGEEAIDFYQNSTDFKNSVFKKICLLLSSFYSEEIEIKSMFHSLMLPGSINPLHWDNYVEDGEKDISTILYLNEGIEGGKLHFPDHGIRITPKAGRLVFFVGDESLMHEVEPVISHKREALVGFCWPKEKRLSAVR